jgi:hypothetical protein
MKKIIKTTGLTLIIPALIGAGIIYFVGLANPDKDTLTSKRTSNVPRVWANFDEERLFHALDRADQANYQPTGQIRGGITPHHDLASDMIAGFFYNLSQEQDFDTIIILGPNHANVANSPAISAHIKWQTPFGTTESNYEILNELNEKKLISFDYENFVAEHSISTLIPFINYYFPKADVVPIIFTTEQPIDECQNLADQISNYSNEGRVIILSSIDFSHYLPASKATNNDQRVIEWINNRDYPKINEFNSDFLDSPASLITLLMAMDMVGGKKYQILDHKNSADYTGDNNGTTSYYSIFFTE